MLWPDFLVERINLCVFPLSGRLEQGAGVGKGGGAAPSAGFRPAFSRYGTPWPGRDGWADADLFASVVRWPSVSSSLAHGASVSVNPPEGQVIAAVETFDHLVPFSW